MEDKELKNDLEEIKRLIRATSNGGIILLLFFMSCVQCSKLDDIERKVSNIERCR